MLNIILDILFVLGLEWGVQGLVNSFGTVAMATFRAAVKIEGFAYMPVQDFGNAFATYVAQNKGAQKVSRIQEGVKLCS